MHSDASAADRSARQQRLRGQVARLIDADRLPVDVLQRLVDEHRDLADRSEVQVRYMMPVIADVDLNGGRVVRVVIEEEELEGADAVFAVLPSGVDRVHVQLIEDEDDERCERAEQVVRDTGCPAWQLRRDELHA
jgi:hypothetical protein